MPKVGARLMQRKVLGTVKANASARLVSIARQSSVLIRETDARFKPLVQKVLTKGKVWRNGAETVAEAEAETVVAASRDSISTRLRLRMRGNQVKAEAGTLTRCFVAGTLVLMANGDLKPIEQVKIGDSVLSRNEATGHTAAKSVTATSVKFASAMVALYIGKERIECTPEHPFYVPGKGFIPAGHLSANTSLIAQTRSTVYIRKVELLSHSVQAIPVYNFTVADYQTYFIGRSNVWVHNQCGWTSPGGLHYDVGSADGNRVMHLFQHLADNPSKPTHSVFKVPTSADLLDLVDEAWKNKGIPVTGDPGAYVIPMGRIVGTRGETSIRIIVRPNTNNFITAYPIP